MSRVLTGWVSAIGMSLFLLSCSDTVVSVVGVDRVVIEPSVAILEVGQSVTLQALPQSADGVSLSGREVTWSSGDEGVVTVNANGVVTAVGVGEAEVSATSEGVRGTALASVIDWPLIGVDRESLRFSALIGATSTTPAGITITNTGAGILSQLAVSVEYEGQVTGWLTAELNAETAPTVLVLSSDPTGRPLGTYRATVSISAPGAGNSPLQISVELEVRNPEPILTGVEPDEGLQRDEVDVVLTGQNFLPGQTAIDFGAGIEVTDFEVLSSTEIAASIAIAEDAALGARSVSVTNPGPGGGTATLEDAFTVLRTFPEPDLESVAPDEGEQGETLLVTLAGSGFVEEESEVSFGAGISVDGIEFVSETQLRVSISVAEDAELGPRDVTVENPTPGGGTATLVDGFEVLQPPFPEPTLTSVSPNEGEQGEQLGVTLTGSGFVNGETQVEVSGSGLTLSGVVIGSETQITLTLTIAEDAELGTRTVTVSNPSPGGGEATGSFEVKQAPFPEPTLTNVSPSSGEQGEELGLVLTGLGFVAGETAVEISGEGLTLSGLVVTSETRIALSLTIAEDAEVGTRTVWVTNPSPGGGQATGSFQVTEAPFPEPNLTGVSPPSGEQGQAVDVELSGTGFVEGATEVSISGNGVEVSGVTVESDTRIELTVAIDADAEVGARTVTVTNPLPGGGDATGDFEVTQAPNPAPTVTDVAPSSGIQGETLPVELSGTGFVEGVTDVEISGSGVALSGVTVVSESELTATITIDQDASPGDRDVTVTNSGPGGGSDTLPGSFAVTQAPNPEPTVSNVTPSSGEQGQTLPIELMGAGFVEEVTEVTISGIGVQVSGVTVESESELTATIVIDQDASPGDRDVTVTNSGPGGGSDTLEESFTVQEAQNPAPTLRGLAPSSGHKGETRGVILHGAGFVDGVTQVGIGGIGVVLSGVSVQSETQIRVTMAIDEDAEVGPRTVTVTNPLPGGGEDWESFEVTEVSDSDPDEVSGVAPVSGGQGVPELDLMVTNPAPGGGSHTLTGGLEGVEASDT